MNNQLSQKEKYTDYLHTPEWKNLSSRLRHQINKCEFCGNVDDLVVHHITYDNVNLDCVGLEYISDIVVICKSCHKILHDTGSCLQIITKNIDEAKNLLKTLTTSYVGHNNLFGYYITYEFPIRIKDWYDIDLLKNLLRIFVRSEDSQKTRQFLYARNRQNIIEMSKIKKENNEMKEIFGIDEDFQNNKIAAPFVWMHFKERQQPLPELGFQDICRYAYLSTYLDYKTNILMNYKTPIKRNELRNVVQLNRSIYNAWLNKLLDLKYINIHDDFINLDKSIFNIGRLVKHKTKKSMRIFINEFQELYESVKPINHNIIGLLFKCIPYLNPYFNCLSANQYETERKKLIPLKLTDLSDELGYSKKQLKRLGNEILSIRFGADKKRIAIAVALDNLNIKDHILMFNAKLFFGGDVAQYKLLNNMFDTYQPSEFFTI